MNFKKTCRTLQVHPNGKYTATPKADADTERWLPALTKVTGGLVAIAGGVDDGTMTYLSTVSYYDIAGNTWKGLKAELNITRYNHSACTLNGIVYVFCGLDGGDYVLNSIEMISESSLLANATTLWQLIDVAENILTKRSRPAVAPLNDTEIAILGGPGESDVIVFNTTTKTCQKVSAGGDYTFSADGNQCVQAGINKVVALVTDKDENGDIDDKPAVISWTKGASAVTIL